MYNNPIWHQTNLAPRVQKSQFGTGPNLAPESIWHHAKGIHFMTLNSPFDCHLILCIQYIWRKKVCLHCFCWNGTHNSLGPARAPRHNTNSTLLNCWQKQSSIDDFYPSSQYKTKQTPNVGNKSPLEKSFHSHWARKGPQTQNYWTVPN